MPAKRTHSYHKLLRRQRTPFLCPHCNVSILIKDYEGHCTKQHGLNARLRCVWCDGKRSWKRGQKDRMIDDHVIECFRNFMLLHCPKPNETPSAPTTYVLFDMTPRCEPLQLYHHKKLPGLDSMAYENFRIFDPDPLPLTYQHDINNLIAAYIRMYLTRPELEFHHLMIRAPAMNQFISYFVPEQLVKHEIYFLPFSCWCDGGTEKEAWFRQHRHMIALGPKGALMDTIWNKIKLKKEEKPFDPVKNEFDIHYKCRKSKKIESAIHLNNTIGYLAQRKSQCNFTFPKGEEGEDNGPSKGQNNHFYIMKSVPSDFKMVACLQWNGGIAELLNQKLRNLPYDKFRQVPLGLVDGRWRIRYRDAPGVPLNVVLPVSKRFKPSDRPTKYYVHLVEGKRFYFEIDREWAKMDDETWHAKQGEMGNLFYHVLGNEQWQLAPHQQTHLTSAKPFWNRNEALEEENARLKEKLAENNVTIAEYKITVAEKDRFIAEKDRFIAEKDQIIAEHKLTIADKDRIIANKDRIIEEQLKRLTEIVQDKTHPMNISIHHDNSESGEYNINR